MVAIGFRGLQGLQGPQVLREQRAKKVILALQVQQGRSAQQAQQVPRDPLELLGLGGLRDLLEVLEIHQRHPGASNPRGPYAPSRERARFSSEFMSALLRDFRQGGPAAIAKVRKYQPAAYMKICALLVPKEMKLEQSGGVKAMSDEQLDAALDALRAILAARAGEAQT